VRKSVSLGAAFALGSFVALAWPTSARAETPLNPVVVVSPVTPAAGADGRAPPNMTLLGLGAATLVLGYVPSWSVAMSSDHRGDDKLVFPVVGPWFDLATRGCTDEIASSRCGTTVLERAALVTDGIVQGLGALQIMGSFFASQKPAGALTPPPMPRFAIVPTMFGGHGVGALGRGRF
jgi:hypothetical protein